SLLQAHDFGLSLVAIRGHELVGLVPRGLNRCGLVLADGFLARLGRSLLIGKELLELRLELFYLGHRIGRGFLRLPLGGLRESWACPARDRQAHEKHRDAWPASQAEAVP